MECPPCNKIEHMSTLDASHSSSIFFENSDKDKTNALMSWALSFWKAWSCFSFQQNMTSFFTNSLSGEARLVKLGTNLL